ncbi:MAG: hypothetical protein U0610_29030 [bacterium]
MLELGVGVELCWPRRANQKGSVENLVGWVKGSFFKQRRFLDDVDLARQLAEWHEEVNTRRPSRATNVIPAERMAEERARLRPLKVRPADLALRYPVFVGPTGFVVFDGQTYSMSPDAIGISGTLFLCRDHVRIVASRFEVTHSRVAAGERSVLPEHRAQMVAAVSGKRAKRYLKRQHLLEIGGTALAYLTELTHRRPQQWVRDVDRLHELLQHHGAEAMRTAFDQALTERVVGAEYVAHYLAAHESVQEALPL